MNNGDTHRNGDGVSLPTVDGGNGTPGDTSRRDFLKVLGVAGAGAAAASCGPPDMGDKLIPYLVPPEDIVPGTNVSYATILTEAGGPEPLGIHATVRDGRVIKLEGNPRFPNRGRLSALAQSALQDLYDPDRIQGPRVRDGNGFTDTDWDAAIAALAGAIVPGRTVLLTSPQTGSSAEFYAAWADAVGAEWMAWEPLGYEALSSAHEIAFGIPGMPQYEINRADRIVSFGADFLGSWLSPVEFGARFLESRRIEQGRQAKFTVVAPRLSLTGLNADEWMAARPGTEAAVALALAGEVARAKGGEAASRLSGPLAQFTPEAVAERAGIPADKIVRLADDLASAQNPIILPPDVSGQDGATTETHLAVALLNYACGAIGSTVRPGEGPMRGESVSAEQMRGLVGRMESGSIETIIVAGANPVYGVPKSLGFAAAFAGVDNRISLNSHLDETAAACDLLLPSSHELESWGDAEIRPGIWAVAQPVMRPIFDTRQREDLLLASAALGGESPFEAADWKSWLETSWRASFEAESEGATSFEDFWFVMLQAGAVRRAQSGVDPNPTLRAGALERAFQLPEPIEGFKLTTYAPAQFYDGRGANRSWMQELPDAVSKAVWNSWVEIHPETAGPLGLETGDLVEIRTSAGSLTAPAFLYEGIHPDAIAIPLGQGHTEFGRTAKSRGVNALDLLDGSVDPQSGALAFSGVAAELTAVGERGRLVILQGNDTDLDREIGEMMQVDDALEKIGGHQVDLRQILETAWDSDPKSPYRWGMAIDLNACTGCGACVTACYAENNIPTVGEDLCNQGREMSWMQIMRYFEETEDDGFQTVHVPVLCQQCGDAPCEPVCPVYAAYHTPEGLNAQVYNRCVGTRYCANNCPYKVRRFNWFTYEQPYPLDLQLNPDVTVRQTGVMEKCTFCVQRINRAKLDAKDEGRHVQDGEIQTACMQTCPTQAIVFGNLKDPASAVSRVAKGARAYHMLGELNTRPAITYLAGVSHAPLAHGGHGEHADEGHEEAGGATDDHGAADDAGH
ncbi:MAG: 4Fe-4S dicluster domain-containing protein [marine benthic group bacterium]|nr:4Fe-4S dicluster domain-containing protein [Gemmatimonadota bacterium]